jgi:hypothetical protein
MGFSFFKPLKKHDPKTNMGGSRLILFRCWVGVAETAPKLGDDRRRSTENRKLGRAEKPLARNIQ